MNDPRNLRLCISGSFGNRDIGDEAMLTADLDFVLNELGVPRRNITLIGHQPDYISSYHHHPADLCFPSSWFEEHYGPKPPAPGWLRRAKARLTSIGKPKVTDPVSPRLTEAVARCDALVVTGGGTINTREREGYSLKRIHALVGFFVDREKPVFMSGQTVGPLGLFAEHDRIAREIIESVDVLTVRDRHYSRRYIELIGAEPNEFIETVDDAFGLPYEEEQLPEDVAGFLARGDAVAVNVTEYTSATREQRAFMAELCEYIAATHRMNILLLGHLPADVFHLTAIRDMVRNDLKPAMFVPNTSAWRDKTLKKAISCCKAAVGGRYHFVVMAGTAGTPFIGMCENHYSYIKQDGYARPLGLQDFILTEKETWDMSILKSRFEQALALQLNIEQHVQVPSPSMQRLGRWVREAL